MHCKTCKFLKLCTQITLRAKSEIRGDLAVGIAGIDQHIHIQCFGNFLRRYLIVQMGKDIILATADP